MTHSQRAFSLTEILVVILVVVVLVGLLMPCIRIVRDMANTAKCASNMHQIGMYLIAYTNENEGLFPGGGHTGTASQSWCDILNYELLSDDAITVQKQSNYTGTRSIICPCFNPPATSYLRCYIMNAIAGGGVLKEYATNYTPPSQRGQQYATWTSYYQGSAIGRFASQGSKVLLQECMRATDLCYSWFPRGTLDLTDSGDYQSANGGAMAFRHGKGRVANFLFMDLHTEAVHPDVSLNADARYAFRP